MPFNLHAAVGISAVQDLGFGRPRAASTCTPSKGLGARCCLARQEQRQRNERPMQLPRLGFGVNAGMQACVFDTAVLLGIREMK